MQRPAIALFYFLLLVSGVLVVILLPSYQLKSATSSCSPTSRRVVYGELHHVGSSYGGHSYLPNLVSNESVIYSVGLGNDVTWDLGVIERHACTVFGFDNTPEHMKFYRDRRDKLPREFKHNSYLLTPTDKTVKMALPRGHGISFSQLDADVRGFKENSYVELPGKCLSTIMRELGHSHIDILKLDVEGAEYELIESFQQTRPVICQILIEFHDRLFREGFELKRRAFKTLLGLGYEISYVGFESSDPDGGVSFFHPSHCCVSSPRVCQMISLLD